MSRRRATLPSIRYSLSPERNKRRVMVTSLGLCVAWPLPLACPFPLAWSWCSASALGSTSVIVTVAKPSGLRSRVPAKMTSSILAPRRLLADCSPSTQLMASLRLDFPQPLGPTIAAIPEPANFISVRSKNDLKPCISTRLSFSKISVPFHYRLGGWVYGNRGSKESKAGTQLYLGGIFLEPL